MHTVLLYYKFHRVKNAKLEAQKHKEVCKALNLKGRVLMNEQGINGTVSGDKDSINRYIIYMNNHPSFKNIDFKKSESDIHPFSKLRVVYRDEIITSGIKNDIDLSKKAKYVTSDTFHQWMKQGEDMVVLDMRNDYEYDVGRFKNSVRPPMKYFRDLKDHKEFFEQFKGKKIVTFCTGGIRCEPASAYLNSIGFDKKNVYQLEGGIVKYAQKYGDEGFFEGKCFVFDERMALDVDTTENAKIVGSCRHCPGKTDVFHNCANKFCNRLFLSCDYCNENFQNTCGHNCQEVIKNPESMRVPRLNDLKILHRNK